MRPENSIRLLSIFVCTLLLTLVIAGCQPGNSGGGGNGAGTKHKLAFVTNNASDFWTIARKGTEKAAKEIPNIEVEFRIPADGTAAEQQRLIDDLLSRGIHGIAISPVDPKNQTGMLNRAAAQTLVVTQDSDAPDSNRTCYIGTDNVAAGRQAGELVKEALPQGGKIMVFVGVLDAANAQQRYQGLKEALAGSNVQIIDVRTDNTDRVRAKSNASDTLVNNPDIAGMVGLWSYNGPAILAAVREANKVDKVKIIAFDEEDETLTGIKDGAIYATVVQQPFEFGFQSMQLMAKYLDGDKSVVPASKQIFVPTIAVKRADVEEFIKKINGLAAQQLQSLPVATNIPILEMEGVSKRFPGVVALDNVSLKVGTGEIVALIGENGAGKSTLMKILGGAIAHDAGTIKINGEPVEIRSPREASARGIEFIHQELSVLDNLDVGANIFLRREPTIGGPLKLIDRKRIYRESDEILKRLGVGVSSRTPLSRLSIAQQQLVEIARALSAGARIIIMDEPTSSLTLTETRRLLELVKDLKQQNVSIIYISHRMHEVEEIADRAVVLRDGKNAGEIQGSEITHERMVRMMVGRDLKDFFKGASTNGRGAKDGGGFEVRRLRTLRYPNHRLSFNVAKGEVLGFAGLVGAGRSEVARAIFGVEEAVETEVALDGEGLSIRGPQDAISHGIYLVPEDRRLSGLIVDFNVRENISLPNLESYSSAKLINFTKESKAALEACKAINIKTPTPEMRAANLSGGNQQKVVLAKWLTFAPRVLIFDEPTRGIDVGAKAEIYQLIRNLAAEGVSVIVISSEMEEVLGISDRIAVMHEGRLTGILDRAQFSEEAVMRLATGTGG